MSPDLSKPQFNHWIQWLKRCQYFSILTISVSLLTYEVYQCVNKFYLHETGTADKYVQLANTEFPQMSVCPSVSYRLDQLKKFGIPTQTAFQYDAQWIANNNQVSPKQLYDEVTRPIEDVVIQVNLFTEDEINGANSFVMGPNDTVCNEALFKVKEYYYNGNCFALTLPRCLQKSGILEVGFYFKEKVDVFIHHHGQFMSPNSR